MTVNNDPTAPPSCPAKDVIHIWLCRDEAAHSHFNPDFTHQLFDGEVIKGFEEPRIDIYLRDDTIECMVNTSHKAMQPGATDLLETLKPALPSPLTVVEQQQSGRSPFEAPKGAQPFSPPGRCILEYDIQLSHLNSPASGNEKFAMYHATSKDPGAVEYHNRVQKLATWFIETADDVNVCNENWEMFYLFSCREGHYALAGYFTVFIFQNPFKGSIMRICQALILPPYQRQGHGKRLISAINAIARKRAEVFEITVEDPAPGFTALRNMVDVEDFVEAAKENEPLVPAEYLEPSNFKCLPDKELVVAQKKSKLRKDQLLFAYECFKRSQVSADDFDALKAFRLMVKERVYRKEKSILGGSKKEKLQQYLDETFRDLDAQYRQLVSRLGLKS